LGDRLGLRAAEETAGNGVETDHSVLGVEHDDTVAQALDDGIPGHRNDVQKAVAKDRGPKGEPGDGEADRRGIDR
jgi:hypothetical protein